MDLLSGKKILSTDHFIDIPNCGRQPFQKEGSRDGRQYLKDVQDQEDHQGEIFLS